jgi:hypothetical protein
MTLWVPVTAEKLPDGRLRVLGPEPNDQDWAYKPGEVVAVERTIFHDGAEGFAATRKALPARLGRDAEPPAKSHFRKVRGFVADRSVYRGTIDGVKLATPSGIIINNDNQMLRGGPTRSRP